MPRSTKDEVKARRAIVSGLLLKGHTHEAIAGKVGLSRSQVTKDVAAVRVEWTANALEDYDEHVAQELERLNGVIRAAWDG